MRKPLELTYRDADCVFNHPALADGSYSFAVMIENLVAGSSLEA